MVGKDSGWKDTGFAFFVLPEVVVGKGSGWEDTGFAFFELPEVGDKPESGGSGGDRCPECAGEVELKSKDGTDGAEVNEEDEDEDEEDRGGGSRRALLRVMTRAR